MKRMTRHVDWDALYVAADRQRRAWGMSWRDVAAATGITPSSLTRVGRYSKTLSTDGFVALLLWLGDVDILPYLYERPAFLDDEDPPLATVNGLFDSEEVR